MTNPYMVDVAYSRSGTIQVRTVQLTGKDFPFETLVYMNDVWKTVERYGEWSKAVEGHRDWTKLLTTGSKGANSKSKKKSKTHYALRDDKVRTLKPDVDLRTYFEKYPDAKPLRKVPTLATLEYWYVTNRSRAVDGCKVEAEGYCQHGSPCWILALEVFK